MGNIKIIKGVFDTKRPDFPVRLEIIGMKRWTLTVTISVIQKLRSMAMWKVTR